MCQPTSGQIQVPEWLSTGLRGPRGDTSLLVDRPGSQIGCLWVPGSPNADPSPLVNGKAPCTYRLEEELQNGTCQQQCPHSRISSPKWLSTVSRSIGGVQLPSTSPAGSPRSVCGSYPSSFQLTTSALSFGSCDIA